MSRSMPNGIRYHEGDRVVSTVPVAGVVLKVVGALVKVRWDDTTRGESWISRENLQHEQ